MTAEERRMRELPERLKPEAVLAKRGTPEFVELYMEQQNTLHQIKLREEARRRAEEDAWRRFMPQPVLHRKYRRR